VNKYPASALSDKVFPQSAGKEGRSNKKITYSLCGHNGDGWDSLAEALPRPFNHDYKLICGKRLVHAFSQNIVESAWANGALALFTILTPPSQLRAALYLTTRPSSRNRSSARQIGDGKIRQSWMPVFLHFRVHTTKSPKENCPRADAQTYRVVLDLRKMGLGNPAGAGWGRDYGRIGRVGSSVWLQGNLTTHQIDWLRVSPVLS